MAAHEAIRRALLGLRDRNVAAVTQAVGVLSRSSGAASALSMELIQHLARLWADGWQPADVVHVAGRNDDDRGALLSAVVAEESLKSCRPGRHVPAAWHAQLDSCGVSAWRNVVGSTPFERAMRRRGITQATAAESALHLLFTLMGLPRLEPLLPPPSAWDKPIPASIRRASDVSDVDQRILAKVRGLLAKAESTTFPEEADALSSLHTRNFM